MQSITASDVLIRGFDLLTEVGYTQGAFARNEAGTSIQACDASAVSLCSVGALHRATDELRCGPGPSSDALIHLQAVVKRDRCWLDKSSFRGVADWNDRQRWPHVRSGWLKAIANAQKAEASITEAVPV